MSKYTYAERELVKSIVASLSLKRIPEPEILAQVYRQTNKTLSHAGLYLVKQSIKKESYQWFKTLREGQYEYLHEFKERINEILSLQKRHYEIIDNDTEPSTVKQASLAELHRLSITLSNLYDVAPSIVNGYTLSATPKTKTVPTEAESIITVWYLKG